MTNENNLEELVTHHTFYGCGASVLLLTIFYLIL